MNKFGFTQFAELVNCRLATIALVSALGAYAMTGQVVPGIW